jgi:hypothetical protein
VRSYLEAEIENSKCPILCPLPNCKIDFAPRDMNTVLSPENMEKYQKYSFLQAVGIQNDISWCPTANCTYAFIYEAGVDSNDFTCV